MANNLSQDLSHSQHTVLPHYLSIGYFMPSLCREDRVQHKSIPRGASLGMEQNVN